MAIKRPLLAAAALALLVLAGCSSGSDDDAKATPKSTKVERTVTVTATGTSKGVPDAMQVNVTISTGGPSAADTLADNNVRTQKVLDQLKITAVDDKDVATTAIDLGPTYDKNGNIKGYAATNSLRITFRSLDSAGAKLDALVAGGDNHVRIEGVTLGFADDDELVGTARVDAVKRAQAQAAEMATAGGATLGEVQTITEVVPETGFYDVAADSARVTGAGSSVPISAGSQELSVQVKVVYALA